MLSFTKSRLADLRVTQLFPKFFYYKHLCIDDHSDELISNCLLMALHNRIKFSASLAIIQALFQCFVHHRFAQPLSQAFYV